MESQEKKKKQRFFFCLRCGSFLFRIIVFFIVLAFVFLLAYFVLFCIMENATGMRGKYGGLGNEHNWGDDMKAIKIQYRS